MGFTEEDLEEFKVEAGELLEIAENCLLKLDQGGELVEQFDSIFRSLHNLKGSAGMMELTSVQSHTHELESIFMTFKGADSIPASHIDLLLRGIDVARRILNGEEVKFDFTVSTENENLDFSLSNKSRSEEVQARSNELTDSLGEGAIEEYIADSFEIIDRVSLYLDILEREHADFETIDGLYREIHTFKGNSYLFSFQNIGRLLHQMETVLEKVRSGKYQASTELVNCLVKCLTILEPALKSIRNGEGDSASSNVIDLMVKALEISDSRLAVGNHDVGSNEMKTEESRQGMKEAIEQVNKVKKINEDQLEEKKVSSSASVTRSKESAGLGSIRVPVALLDGLMNLVGEMVLVRNQVLQFSQESEDFEFLKMSKKLNIVTSEIQDEMMKTRMQPIGNLLQKFNRVVRDLANDLEKKVQLDLVGVDTELDKTLLEAIKDPLTHIVRNSCDHGIELPGERVKNGKGPSGTITIKAYHEGGQVIIEISDDGKGLDCDDLVQSAIKKGVIDKDTGASLSNNEALNLIFAPGFSTAASITNVSGRGVGMDVVKTNIEGVGGTIELFSKKEEGTTIRIRIPLTLAIVPALLVKCGHDNYAIPQVKLEELLRIDRERSEEGIVMLHDRPIYKLRGSILPLVDMTNILNPDREKRTSYSDAIYNIAVLNSGQGRIGIIVDEILDTADIVVKPINKIIKSLQIYSGSTILGDGSIALIFDVGGIFRVSEVGTGPSDEDYSNDTLDTKCEEKSLLTFGLNSQTTYAVALSYVSRLEEFDCDQIEESGKDRIIRYGNDILPLVYANDVLDLTDDISENDNESKVSVIVMERAGRMYGIVVNRIVDTMQTEKELCSPLKDNGYIFGNLNLDNGLVIVLDPFEVIDSTYPLKACGPIKESHFSGSILLVEDTTFFQKSITNILEKNGFKVTLAKHGAEAIELFNQEKEEFDLIVSDIEMPKMNGFEMARCVRHDLSNHQIPMIALSSKADEAYIKEGLDSGFNLYLEKLKPQVLLDAINELKMIKKVVA